MQTILIGLDTRINNYASVDLMQGYNYTLEAHITDNYKDMDLTGVTVQLQMQKPDKKFIIQTENIIIEGNKIKATLDKDFTREDGQAKLQVVLLKDNFTFGSWVVKAKIKPSAINDNDGQSENKVTITEALVNKISEAENTKIELDKSIANGDVATIKGNVDKIKDVEIPKINEQLEHKANEADVKTLENRMNSFTALPEQGVTTVGDAELVDGRVGIDGISYDNIGSAIRNQLKNINYPLNSIKKHYENLIDVEFDLIEENKIYSTVFPNGATVTDYKSYTKNVKENEIYKITMETVENDGYALAYLYDGDNLKYTIEKNDNVASVFYKNYELVIPVGVTKMITTPKRYTETLKLRSVEYNLNTLPIPNFSYRVISDGIEIVFKNKTKDFMITLGKHGGNNLFDFFKFSNLENISDYPSINFDNAQVLKASYTDWHSPFVMKAINNIDGDNKKNDGSYNIYFTGGNHQYNNSGEGSSKTATTLNIDYIIDGQEISNGSGFGNNLKIKWTNLVQGYNTTKIDGTGRGILKENHILTFNGFEWASEVELIAIEDLEIEKYYGLQGDLSGFSNNTIQFVGGSNRKIMTTTLSSDCGNGKAQKIIAKGDLYAVEIEIDTTYDIGSFSNYKSPFLFYQNYGKCYFNLFNGVIKKDEIYSYRGKYKFYEL